MSEATSSDATWMPWRVAPDSGFEVADPSGSVGIVQIDDRRFLVLHAFRFGDRDVERALVQELLDDGMEETEARRAVDEARTFSPREDNPTDLASIPRFMRWFEDPYGKHSLAALIHDELITAEVNGGRLRSDTLADRFFRDMMRASGVPWLKRWIMWSAVALRTRFAAGGRRRWSVVIWVVLSVIGLGCASAAVGTWALDWPAPIEPSWLLLVIAAALPIVAAGLWGEQWGASLVFAVTAFWLVPAAAIAGAGWLVYLALERLASRAGLD
jgi:hypothetical protein